MATISETSDEALLDLLRCTGAMTIAEIAVETEVTQNAVRQRLTRLMAQDLVCRTVDRGRAEGGSRRERGRPNHRYSLTEKARRRAGNNFADLAIVLWQEIRAVKDAEVQRGLLKRIADAMARHYQGLITGATTAERMQSVGALLGERRVPVTTVLPDPVAPDAAGQLPVLKVEDCPYPELAEQDRGICAVEKMVFSQLLDEDVRLTQCRLDGHSCCQFETG
jgi:DeoR family suf operon transcriptional repressor